MTEEQMSPEDTNIREANATASEQVGEVGESEVEQLRQRLEQAQKEADAFKDRYLRAMADMENTRKRVEKEKQDLLQYGLEKLMNDMLPVLDSVETALRDLEGDQNAANVTSLLSGFQLTKKQLADVLAKHGLAALESERAKFDPNLHQAIQRIESEEVQDDTIKQVFVKGYTLHGRLIRPAMVSVEVPVGQ